MKSLLLSQNRDIVTGLRLAGIEGIFCKDIDRLKSEFKNATTVEIPGILILTEDDFDSIREEVLRIKLTRKLPLVVTIPGPNGLKDKDFIMKYIRDSVGIKID